MTIKSNQTSFITKIIRLIQIKFFTSLHFPFFHLKAHPRFKPSWILTFSNPTLKPLWKKKIKYSRGKQYASGGERNSRYRNPRHSRRWCCTCTGVASPGSPPFRRDARFFFPPSLAFFKNKNQPPPPHCLACLPRREKKSRGWAYQPSGGWGGERAKENILFSGMRV